jgi:hypothetical protein
MNFRRNLVATILSATLTCLMGSSAWAGPPSPARDADADRLADWWESAHGLSINFKSTWKNPDRDGVHNLAEFRARTKPRDEDTDNDGIDDGDELKVIGSDPRSFDQDASGMLDGDEGGTPPITKEDLDDYEEACDADDDDLDGDGLDDEDENDFGSDGDADDDAMADVVDPDSDGDGLLDGDDDSNDNHVEDEDEDDPTFSIQDACWNTLGEESNDEERYISDSKEALLAAAASVEAYMADHDGVPPSDGPVLPALEPYGYEARYGIDMTIEVDPPPPPPWPQDYGYCLAADHYRIWGAWTYDPRIGSPSFNDCW